MGMCRVSHCGVSVDFTHNNDNLFLPSSGYSGGLFLYDVVVDDDDGFTLSQGKYIHMLAQGRWLRS